jgi:hypothetical protein
MIKVFIFAFNRPDLLSKQIDSLKKHLIGDYSIEVLYDYREDKFGKEFEKICLEKDANLIRHQSLPNKSPSQYHADSLSWVYHNMINDEDTVIFLDHDMFLIDDFDLIDYLREYDISGCLQSRGNVEYTWPGLLIFRYSSIKNIEFDFNPKFVEGHSLDSGGGTYKILRDKNIKFLPMKLEYPDSYKNIDLLDPNNNNGFGFELFIDGKFLHFRNACSWHKNMEVNDTKKTEILNTILKDFL